MSFLTFQLIFAELPQNAYTDKFLYLHALVNYEVPPQWTELWERNAIRGTGTLFSYGSIEVHDLLCNMDLQLNHNIGSGWWFFVKHKTYAGQHIDEPIQDTWLGFEKYIYDGFSLYAGFNPAKDKEWIDAKVGVSWSNATRDQYLRLGMDLNDFVWQEKNPRDGVSLKDPVGFSWQVKYGNLHRGFYSEGNWNQGFRRRFLSPGVDNKEIYHAKKTERQLLRIYYSLPCTGVSILGLQRYFYEERKRFAIPDNDFHYGQHLYTVSFRQLLDYRRWHARFHLDYVNCKIFQHGASALDYIRDDWMPSVFLEYRFASDGIELAYMQCFFDWRLRDYTYSLLDYRDQSIEKMKLGWTHYFSEKVRLQLSLSHVFSVSGFGGGNVQMILLL